MTLAQDRLAALAAWIDASSGPRRTPMAGDTLIGPWAVIVAADFSEPPAPEFDIDALPLWVSAAQAEGVALPPIVTAAPPSQTRMAYRLGHLIFRVQDGTLPPCAIVGLDSPAEPILAAVERAGAGAVDLATFPLLAAPLWALSPAHRAELAPKFPMLR